MSFLPPPPIKPRGAPVPPVSAVSNTVVYGARPLPIPFILPNDFPKTTAGKIAVIKQIKEERETPKGGRKSKDEMKKIQKMARSDRVRSFLETKPDKKDVLEYFRSRVMELADY